MASQKVNVPHLIVFTDLDEEFDDKLAVYFISKLFVVFTIGLMIFFNFNFLLIKYRCHKELKKKKKM